jgi:methionine aminotransferase
MVIPPSKLPHVGTTIFSVMSALAQAHGAINLAQGFPEYSSSPRLMTLVSEAMQAGHNQYAPMPGLPILRERLAEKINRAYSCDVDSDQEITITAGATQALFTAIGAFIRPGDEVILLEPAYDAYRPAVELFGGIPVPIELMPPHFVPDWNRVAAAVSDKTRMIVVNTPHNPTGAIFNSSDLDALHQITANTNILILSDEVYEHLVFEERAMHQSVLRHPGLRKRSLAVYSFGKTFHNTGWKIGYCVAPAALSKEFRKVHQFNVFSVNTPMQYALATFLENPAEYLSLPSFYRQKRDFFLEAMRGSRLKALPCQGTYFTLFDYSAVSKEPDVVFAQKLTIEYGVAAIPVSVFYSDGRDNHLIRLCFAKSEATLAKAGDLLRRI